VVGPLVATTLPLTPVFAIQIPVKEIVTKLLVGLVGVREAVGLPS
jgi:hypothetical protein